LDSNKVWIIAWESWQWPDESQHVPERHLASILRGDLSASTVREIVEAIHASRCCSIEERLMWAKDYQKNRCKAEIGESQKGGEMITCGYNPILCAIRIEDPKITKEGDEDYLAW